MTHSAANVEWRNMPEEEGTVLIRMPIILAPSMTSADVTVTVADSSVVVVKVAGSLIWQCRLYAAVQDDVEWTLENNKSILAMEITKKTPDTWPALLNVTMKVDDSNFFTADQLNERIARELPSLPPVDAPVAEAAAAVEEKKVEEIADEEEKADGEEAEKKEETTAAAEEGEKKEEETPAAEEEAEATAAATEETKEEEKEATAEEVEEKEDGEKPTPAAEEAEAEAEKKEGEEEATAAATTTEEEPAAAAAAATEEEEKEKDPLDMLDDEDLLNDALEEVIPGSTKTAAPAATTTTTVDGEEAEKKKETTAAVVAAVVAEEKKKEKTAEEIEEEEEAALAVAQTRAEMRGIEMESEAVTEKLEEMMTALAAAEVGSEEHKTLSENVKVASRMLEIIRETRELRSQPATVENFLKVQQLDILKARVNIGETGPSETEEYADEMEKTLNGLQLFNAGIRMLQQQDPALGVHYLRLAAIHHHHAPSVVALYSLYTNVPSSYPRGASILLENALRGEGTEVDARINARVGDLFNNGTRHFPPVFALAVYFYQRAALAGSAHAMVSLALLLFSGECNGDSSMPARLKKFNTDEKRGNYFLQCAIDRGSITAYLARAAQYAVGANGMPKDLVSAKQYYDKAVAAEASLTAPESQMMRIGSEGLTLGALAKLVNGESEADKKKTATAGASSGVLGAKKAAADDDDEIVEVRPTTKPSASSSLTTTARAGAPPSAGGARLGGYDVGASRGGMSVGGPISAPAKGSTGAAASGAKSKQFWERAARWGVGAYALYTLAFPLRIIMLPFFYDKVATIMELFGLGGSAGSIDSL